MRLGDTSALVGLLSLLGIGGAMADPVLVSLQPTASGVCACDLSNKVMASFRMAPGSNFKRTRAVDARIGALEAAGVNLEGADFTDAKLPNARFTGAVLRAASFRGAKLARSDFTRAELAEADFTGAALPGADLETAMHLTAAQLRNACGDASTRLPDGLTLPDCSPQLDAAPPEHPEERVFEVEPSPAGP